MDAVAGYNVLGTVAATTSWMEHAGRRRPPQERVVEFLDFTIDAVPLRRVVTGRPEELEGVQDMTELREADGGAQWAVAALRRLLQQAEPDFADGRVSLLVCPICADLDCAAYSAEIVWHEDSVEWRDIGWQVTYEPFTNEGDPEPPVLTFRFERAAYEAVLSELLAHFEALAIRQAADRESPSTRRRFWQRMT